MSTYEIIMTVLAVLFGGLSLYLKANKKVDEAVAGFIDEAEEKYRDATKVEGVKFNYVVDKIYSIIPNTLKPFITRKLVKSVIQKTFDIMESYAKKQADKFVNKVIPDDKK